MLDLTVKLEDAVKLRDVKPVEVKKTFAHAGLQTFTPLTTEALPKPKPLMYDRGIQLSRKATHEEMTQTSPGVPSYAEVQTEPFSNIKLEDYDNLIIENVTLSNKLRAVQEELSEANGKLMNKSSTLVDVLEVGHFGVFEKFSF